MNEEAYVATVVASGSSLLAPVVEEVAVVASVAAVVAAVVASVATVVAVVVASVAAASAEESVLVYTDVGSLEVMSADVGSTKEV